MHRPNCPLQAVALTEEENKREDKRRALRRRASMVQMDQAKVLAVEAMEDSQVGRHPITTPPTPPTPSRFRARGWITCHSVSAH